MLLPDEDTGDPDDPRIGSTGRDPLFRGDGVILGEGGMALRLERDWLILSEPTRGLGDIPILGEDPGFTRGSIGGATSDDDTDRGDGAGDKAGNLLTLNDPKFWENEGVTVGLGVELRAVPTEGFKTPAAATLGLVLGFRGTKTDDRGVDIYLI